LFRILEVSGKGENMIQRWNNTDTFKRHIQDMKSFRRAHTDPVGGEPEKTAKEISAPQINNIYTPEDTGRTLTDENGHIIVVPIQDIEMPGGSQN
jgi:hypothetical protein